MKQKVHSVSYLAKAEFELKNGVYDLVALPTGAEVVKVRLEVVGDPMGWDAHIYVGFKDEAKKNYFLDLSLERTAFADQGQHTISTFTSEKDYTAISNKVVVANVERSNDRNGNDIKCTLRVVYFLPSVIEVEY